MTSTAKQREERARVSKKLPSGGNSKIDNSWFEEVLEAGELFEPEEAYRPAGFLYEINYQWEFSIEDINLEFFESYKLRLKPSTVWCNGTAYIRDPSGMYIVDSDWVRLTRPCLVPANKGAKVCKSHGGNIPQVKAAAERVIASAAEVVAMRLVGLTAPTDELQERIAHKDRISASNSVLDRAGIKSGVDIEVSIPGYKKVLDKMFEDDSSAPE